MGGRGSPKLSTPDFVLAFDEAYCLSTNQLSQWARSRKKPSLYLSCQNINRPIPFPFQLVETKVLRTVSGGWFLNQEARDRAQNRGFHGSGRIIPLPVNPEDYPLLEEGVPLPIHPETFKVGYAGRLVPEKGLTTLIEACSQTGDRLLVVGEGPERDRLQRKAERSGVEVDWLGSVPSEEMPAVYSGMSVLVLPSLETPRWKEQFGRVLVEAMASGVPVIGSRTGEIPKVIGEAGLLFEPGSVRSLTDQIQKLKEKHGLWETLRNRGLERVRQGFTLDRVGEQVLRLLEEISSPESSV